MYEYNIIKETEKALLIEFNVYKGVKEELMKLNTWIPKAWTKKENDCRIGQNIEKALNEHSEKFKNWMMSKGYGHKGCKFSLKKAVVKKATHKDVDYYIDASFFPLDKYSNEPVTTFDYIHPKGLVTFGKSIYDKSHYILDFVLDNKDGFFVFKKGQNKCYYTDDKEMLKLAKEHDNEILELKDIKIYKRLTKNIKDCYLWTRRHEKI